MQGRTSMLLAGLAAALLAGGCASNALGSAEKLAIYQAAAGEPVNSFSYLGRIDGWTPIDDRHIAVWTRPREAWLLGFHGTCLDIEFAPVISIRSSHATRVLAGFDSVIVHSPTATPMPCRIREIRPLDTTRVRAAEKAAREGAQAPESGT